MARSGPVGPADGSVRALMDQVPAVLWTTDERLVFTSFLGAGLERLGLGPNQPVGMRLSELLVEKDDDRAEVVVAHRRALLGETVKASIDWGGRSLEARVGPLRDSSGRVIGTVGVGFEFVPARRTVTIPADMAIVLEQVDGGLLGRRRAQAG